jgi:dimethylhistidine N-methyltransferase
MSSVGAIRLASAHRDVDAFAQEVQYYLSLAPRQLPSRYLYDPLGSSLFEAICHLPWYPITRAERRLLAKYGAEILHLAGEPPVVVELGSGSGEKLGLLLQGETEAGLDPVRSRRATGAGPRVAHLIDVSAAALSSAAQRLAAVPRLTVVPHPHQYEEGLAAVKAARRPGEHALALFLGSNIGNFDPPGTSALLEAIRANLRSGDAFLVGADLVKPEPVLLAAYDDPLGVTAAFNKNLLVRLNSELDANFALDQFAHRALWNAAESRVEMHLESRRQQMVRVPRAGLAFTLERGERIWTESSYKYEPSALRSILARAGFEPLEAWLDVDGRFLLQLNRVR